MSYAGSAFTGFDTPRPFESLADYLVRVLRQAKRPVAVDVLARIAGQPENVVLEAVRQLEAQGVVVRVEGDAFVLRSPEGPVEDAQRRERSLKAATWLLVAVGTILAYLFAKHLVP